MPTQRTTTVYKYPELSEAAKLRALEWYYSGALDYDWWDSIYDMAKSAAKIIGLDIGEIHFSGFASQGDGAGFSGHYRYAKGAAKAIRAEFPQTKELHRIADALQKAQSRNFYRLIADVSEGRGFFLHCSVYDDANRYRDIGAYEDDIAEALRDFANWLYRALEKEHDYLTSREQMEEMVIANGYEFDEEGNIA